MLDWDNGNISIKLLCLYAAPNKGTTILDWFRSLSTVLSPTENIRILKTFQGFWVISSTSQGRFNFQGLFKKAL